MDVGVEVDVDIDISRYMYIDYIKLIPHNFEGIVCLSGKAGHF